MRFWRARAWGREGDWGGVGGEDSGSGVFCAADGWVWFVLRAETAVLAGAPPADAPDAEGLRKLYGDPRVISQDAEGQGTTPR